MQVGRSSDAIIASYLCRSLVIALLSPRRQVTVMFSDLVGSTALSARVRRTRCGRCRSRNGDGRCALLNAFEVGNRAQQLAAMAEQDAQLLQILIRQIGEDAEIDRIIEEAAAADLVLLTPATIPALALLVR